MICSRCRCSMAHCFCRLPVRASPMVCNACKVLSYSRTFAPENTALSRSFRATACAAAVSFSVSRVRKRPVLWVLHTTAPTNSRMPRMQCTVCISGSTPRSAGSA